MIPVIIVLMVLMGQPNQVFEDPVLLERRLGYVFGRPEFLSEALSHRSYVFERTGESLADNERLEFLGDAVLELAITALVHRLHPQASEGRLTRLRARLVNEQTMSRLAREVGLGGFLKLGRGEAASGGAKKPSLLADALEAVLGAVFLDGGYEAAFRVVRCLWGPLLEEDGPGVIYKDHKTRLQELLQEQERLTPTYTLTGSQGPDHQRTFQVEVRVRGRVLGAGEGRSKKEAEQEAARMALAEMERAEVAGKGGEA